MKKRFAVILMLCLSFALPVFALAEREETQIVGLTPQWDYIHRYTAENGAEIYFTSIEERPRIEWEDVNFDGAQDIVVLVNAGASNAMYEFFVREGEGYTYARYGTIDYGLANYRLDGENGYVISHANNGAAGAMFDMCIFRWEGSKLKLVRRANSDLVRESAYDEEQYTETTYLNRLRITVQDYQTGEMSGTVIWEKQLDFEAIDASILDEANARLWQGLRK